MQAAQAATPPSLSHIIQRNHDLLTEKEAANFLNVAPGTLSVWRSVGRYAVPFLKVGSKVRYRRSDLEAWLESRTRSNGATA
jgi:excisionase family DNA binding protein